VEAAGAPAPSKAPYRSIHDLEGRLEVVILEELQNSSDVRTTIEDTCVKSEQYLLQHRDDIDSAENLIFRLAAFLCLALTSEVAIISRAQSLLFKFLVREEVPVDIKRFLLYLIDGSFYGENILEIHAQLDPDQNFAKVFSIRSWLCIRV